MSAIHPTANTAVQSGPVSTGPGPVATPIAGRRLSIPAGLFGVAPFIIFSVMFLVIPTLYLLASAFFDPAGNFTLANMAELGRPQIVSAFWTSLKLSAVTAILGVVIGLTLALALIRGGLPSSFRSAVLTFSGVASQFAGVPLAFAFLATIGRLGLVTVILRDVFGLNLYGLGFNILSFWGLTVTYLYFQIPLMILIIAPAIDGLKREWGEAAATLGATRGQFWRYIGLPVLWPSLLGTLSLLFANAFGAIATAFSLTGSSLNILPILLYSQIRGDALNNPGLGAAIAVAMVLVTSGANLIYLVLRSRAERWLK